MGAGEDKFVFIKSEDYAWYPCRLVKMDNVTATVIVPKYKDEKSIVCDGMRSAEKRNDEVSVKLSQYKGGVLPMQNVDANGNGVEYPDMVQLPFLHEAAILYNLKMRHMNSEPYTRTGDIIVAINPFQWFTHLYTEKMRTYYSNRLVWEKQDGDVRSKMEPHVYETSALSFQDLAFGQQDQSILVSGESGAGKTETVKICMNHIASVQRGPIELSGDDSFSDPVVDRVLQSNPLLEAFGNAKTARNDNSSRFGKYVQLQFDNEEANMAANFDDRTKSYCTLAGSKCEVYLLEKNRITGHESNERTYHIFYQLIASPESKNFWGELGGKTNESYKYVGYTDTQSIENKSDKDHFDTVLGTLKLINVDGEALKNLMKAICAVMQCGNLVFEEDPSDSDKSRCSTLSEVNFLADLMGVTNDDLILAFTERTMKTRNETYKVPLNQVRAKDTCDSFAKEIYSKVFLWLVKQINVATCAEDNYKGGSMSNFTFGIIGLLDIFGFESFLVNRFEQLCINYANEKLQQKFTEDIFRSVQEEYESEGIELAEISYDDNTDVLDLIEARTGLLALLNEECVRPKGTAEGFVLKAINMNKKSSCLFENKLDSRMSFGIHHFAGKVVYTCDNFVTRNQDTLPTDLLECAKLSSNSIISNPAIETKVARKGGDGGGAVGGKGRRSRQPKRQQSNIVSPTVWTKYKTQLTNLMTDLRATKSRYIRCIKPNMAKKPILMEHVATVEQLRCAGVIAAITLSRSAFPNRLENEVVRLRFATMWDKRSYPSNKLDSDNRVDAIRKDIDAMMTCALRGKVDPKTGKKAFVVGRTRTYFRQGALEFLETNRAAGMDNQAIEIQRVIRGYLVRRKFGNPKARREEEERKRREEEERIRQEEERKRRAAEKKAKEAHESAERKRREEKARRERELREKKEKLAKLKQAKEEKEARRQEEEEAKEVVDGLKLQIKQLQKVLEEKRKRNEKEISAALKSVEAEEEKMDALKQKYEKQENEANKIPAKEVEQIKKKADESEKVVKFLKKENTRLRDETEQMEDDLKKMKQTNTRLIEANATAGASLETLNKQAKVLKEHNKKLEESIDEFKQANKKLDHDLKGRQAYFEAETKIREDYEQAMEKIVQLIEENCDDAELVEKVATAQLACLTSMTDD